MFSEHFVIRWLCHDHNGKADIMKNVDDGIATMDNYCKMHDVWPSPLDLSTATL